MTLNSSVINTVCWGKMFNKRCFRLPSGFFLKCKFLYAKIYSLILGQVNVGFHAYMSSSKTYAKGAVYVYDKVVTNTHNAYNATTGIFVAPERGLYIFSYDTLTDPRQYAHPMLVVNGKIKSWQACNNSNGGFQYITCSSTSILQLKRGDVVYVADQNGKAMVREKYTDFSGAKLN